MTIALRLVLSRVVLNSPFSCFLEAWSAISTLDWIADHYKKVSFVCCLPYYRVPRQVQPIPYPRFQVQEMFPAKSLLSFLAVAVYFGSVTASPTPRDSKVTLSFARHINSTGFGSIAEADRARAKVLKDHALSNNGDQAKRAASFAVTNAVVSADSAALF